jgi:transcription antitermination factor NusA-like protein
MAYNPELVKQLLGEQVAELFDGTIEIDKSEEEIFENLKVGNILSFKFKNDGEFKPRQFIIIGNK